MYKISLIGNNILSDLRIYAKLFQGMTTVTPLIGFSEFKLIEIPHGVITWW